MISYEIDLQISPGDIDRTHRVEVPNSNKNRSVIIKFVQYIDTRQIFTNKKILKGKNLSITVSLTNIRMRELNEARNKFRFRNVWTSYGKMCTELKVTPRPRFILHSVVTSSSCYG